MHELSIMMNVLDIVLEHANQSGANSVRSILLRVGEHSGVMTDSLRFAFDAVIKDTIAESASLQMEMIPLTARCPNCENEFIVQDSQICPTCSNIADIIAGQELQIQSIVVE